MGAQRKIAVLEDDQRDYERLRKYLDRYAQEKQLSFEITAFRDGFQFLDSYRQSYDLILMDVEMPGLDGMKTARRLREKDSRVPLIFITRMAQYAVNGYEVSALDYIVKPVSYGTLMTKLDHAFIFIERMMESTQFILLNLGADSFRRIAVKDIYYIVKDKNYLLFVTRDGEFRVRGTMKEEEERLAGSTIVKCASGCLVNLRYIEQKVKNAIYIHGVQFAISRQCQQEFSEKCMKFMRGELS